MCRGARASQALRLALLAIVGGAVGIALGNVPGEPRQPALQDLQDCWEAMYWKSALPNTAPAQPRIITPFQIITSLMEGASRGDRQAQYKLGLVYDTGWNVPRDPTVAMSWFRKAAEQGLQEAQYLVGRGCAFGDGTKVNEAEAIGWYEKAAAQDYLPAISEPTDCFTAIDHLSSSQ